MCVWYIYVIWCPVIKPWISRSPDFLGRFKHHLHKSPMGNTTLEASISSWNHFRGEKSFVLNRKMIFAMNIVLIFVLNKILMFVINKIFIFVLNWKKIVLNGIMVFLSKKNVTYWNEKSIYFLQDFQFPKVKDYPLIELNGVFRKTRPNGKINYFNGHL